MRRAVVLAAALLAACSFAPKYERPANELPDAWRGAPAQGALGAPSDRWWTVYGDPTLDKLVEESLANNQDIALAVARVDEARALVGVSESQLWPSIEGNVGANRSRASSRTDLFFPGVPGVSHELPGDARHVLRDRFLGPDPQRQRGRPGRPPGDRRRARHRADHAGDRRGAVVLRAAVAGRAGHRDRAVARPPRARARAAA